MSWPVKKTFLLPLTTSYVQRSLSANCSSFFCVMQCEEQLKIVVQSFFKQPNRYPLSTTLVPAAIELHQCMYKGSHAPLYFLLSHCVSTLQHKGVIGTPNWSNNFDLNCRCELCTVLTAFLNNPAEMQEYQSQLALLHHVHPLLEQLEKPSKLRRLKADHQWTLNSSSST